MASEPVAKGGKPRTTDRLVEWLAWALQLAAGFVVGCAVGYQAARLLFRADLETLLVLAAGAGLVCGAFTSYYGDRAWMARSIFLAPESLPPLKARACSLIVGCIGFAVALLAAAHHVTSALNSSSRPSAGFDVLLVLAALLPGLLVLHALRTGTGFWRFGILDREETPLLFWVYVVLNVCAFLGILLMML
jgi:hypothetical protein